MEFAKLNLSNYKPWVFASGLSSLLAIILASFGDFQKISVYQESTGMNMPAYKYYVTKEFNKFNPNVTGLEKIAWVERSYTAQKITYSIAGIISGCACLILAVQEDKLEQVKDYKHIKDTEYQKMQIDMNLAVNQKVQAETAKIAAVNIMQDLLSNPTYRKLKEQQIGTEQGEVQGAEDVIKEENSWNPFNDNSSENEEYKLSDNAQKVLKWLRRKQTDYDYISTEMCRASGCVNGAKTADIQGYYREIVEAKIAEMNERGDIRLV